MSGNEEAQTYELIALESIYGECFHAFESAKELKDKSSSDISEDSLKGGELKIFIELPSPFHLHFVSSINGKVEKHAVEHLPPLYLHFTFPKAYPSDEPPLYTLSCKWIDRIQLSILCKRLDTLWEENAQSEIMFTWAQCLKEEMLDMLHLTDSVMVTNSNFRLRTSSDKSHKGKTCDELCSDVGSAGVMSENGSVFYANSNIVCCEEASNIDSRTVQDIGPNINLLRVLIEYDEEMRKKVFNLKLFLCKVCFSEKSGNNCIDFWPCHHVYCKDCMKSYFEIQIREGNARYLKCPEEKCESEANPKQVENLVTLELYHKWDLMLLNSTLSSLGDIQPCPRQHCQYPVTIEENQGQCPSCAFVFCGLCRFGWHGVEKCKFKSGEAKKILETYMNGHLEERMNLEERFGKKYLESMVNEYLSSKYMEDNAKDCPKCRCSIEKIEGCNKMTCRRCDTNFCWLCEKLLDKMNPYNHFNNPNSECFNMLFHGIEVRGFEEIDSDEEDDGRDDYLHRDNRLLV